MANIPNEQVEQRLKDIGVYLWPKVLSPQLAAEAAQQSNTLLVDTMARHRDGATYKSPFLRVDPEYYPDLSLGKGLLHIFWETDENDDQVLAEKIKNVTGVECEAIFRAARILMKSVGLMQGGEDRELAIFRTTSLQSLNLHRDYLPSSLTLPDENLERFMLHLRGGRQMKFAEELKREAEVDVVLEPGDAYQFKPECVYHGATYSDQSLALYLQT